MKRAVKRRIGAVGLVAALVLAAAWAAKPPGASAEAGDLTIDAAAAQCGGAVEASPEAQALLEQLQQRVLSAEQQPDFEAGGEYVVLNNRGYNYGPAPDVYVDAELFRHEDAGAALR